MVPPRRRAILLFFLGLLSGPRLLAQADAEPAEGPSARPWPAVATVLAVNTFVWGVNRFVKNEDWARVGPDTWARNLRKGFEWDDDGFQPNQLAHPYHGSIYFGAARANGYGYWAAAPFTAGGSLMWEYLGETKRPSLNDLINTTLGGMALGEVSYRLSGRLLASGGDGRAGIGRALAAAALNPGAALHGSPADPRLEAAPVRQQIVQGYARGGDAAGAVTSHPYVALTVQSGTPFDAGRLRPFDVFELHLEATGGESTVITRTRVNGILGRALLHEGETTQLALTLAQRYDYVNTTAHQWGEQSVSGGLVYRRQVWPGTALRVGAHLNGTVLGAISSEHAPLAGRDYDYGPGIGTIFTAAVRRGGADLVGFERKEVWLRSLSGAGAGHRVTQVRVGLQLPATRLFAVGAEGTKVVRSSRYAGLEPVMRRLSQLRAYIALASS